MGVSLGYGDPGQTSQQFPGSDKVDDLVGAEPPAPLLGGALAAAFYQDLLLLAHQAGMGLFTVQFWALCPYCHLSNEL